MYIDKEKILTLGLERHMETPKVAIDIELFDMFGT